MDLSKIEAGRLEIEPVEFYLTVMLHNLVEMIRIRTNQKQLTFRYEQVSDLPLMVYGDEKRLRQVLLNVLGNAVKFTEHGKVYFRVGASTSFVSGSLEPEQRENNLIRFCIQDTGGWYCP